MRRALIALVVIMVTVLWTWGPVGSVRFVAHDPGPRAGDDGAGGPLAGITDGELKLWVDGLTEFLRAETVADGLGPRFNGLSCAECHKQGGVGGTAPAVNPQVAAASALGATNVLPSFITLDGPVREARFKSDGGVHALFTIAGRSDAPGCAIEQEDFAAHMARGNVTFRVPDPGVRGGSHRGDPRGGGAREPSRARPAQALVRRQRQGEPERERRAPHHVRMEGAERLAPDVLRRGLQRGDGHHQRTVPAGARSDPRAVSSPRSRTTSPRARRACTAA